MTDDPGGHGPADLARDWLTIWQSELSASATDREHAETWTRLLSIWGHTGSECLAMLRASTRQPRNDGQAGRPPPASPARPSSADAAPDPRDAAINALVRRIGELERRLARLEPAAPG